MKIRRMKLEDFNDMYALWKKSGIHLVSYERELQEVVMMLDINPDSCFVIVERNMIIGSIFGVFNGRRAWIYHLAVDPLYQRMGLGSQLLKKAEDVLLKKGTAKIRLFIEFDNLRVFHFYEKNKYKVISDAVMVGKDF